MFCLCAITVLAACSKGSSSTGSSQPKTATVTTIAGSGSAGSGDGTGSSATFYQPLGLAMDAAGNLYVADDNNNCIRKVTPDGVVTTFAGSSAHAGHLDGQGTAAQLYGPAGLTIDKAGNLYVSEWTNADIRKISPSGAVTTLAGGTQGYQDGTGSSAQFDYPYGLGIDNDGNVIVADSYNQRIRKVTPGGVVTTVAGSGATGPGNGSYTDGPVASSTFQSPFGLYVDASGDIYVADEGNNVIRVISGGSVSTVAGSGSIGYQDGPVASAEFAAPHGVVVDGQGNIFVSDHTDIREVSHGSVTTVAGSPTGASGFADGVGTAALFNGPAGIVLDPSGNLYVVDEFNNALRKITFK